MEQTATSVLQILNNISETYPELLTLMEAICYVGGLFLVIMALLNYRHGRNIGVGAGSSTIASVVIGVLLINLPMLISSISLTFFSLDPCASGTPSFEDYLSAENCKSDVNYLIPVIKFVQIYGFFAIIRGLFLINRAHKPGMGNQVEDLSVKGWVHVVAGFMCIYIIPFFDIAATTFGLSEEAKNIIESMK